MCRSLCNVYSVLTASCSLIISAILGFPLSRRMLRGAPGEDSKLASCGSASADAALEGAPTRGESRMRPQICCTIRRGFAAGRVPCNTAAVKCPIWRAQGALLCFNLRRHHAIGAVANPIFSPWKGTQHLLSAQSAYQPAGREIRQADQQVVFPATPAVAWTLSPTVGKLVRHDVPT